MYQVPSMAEFDTLIKNLGGSAQKEYYVASGGKMKEAGTTHWLSSISVPLLVLPVPEPITVADLQACRAASGKRVAAST